MVDEKLLRASAVLGFWPANRVDGDDIALYADERRLSSIATAHHIRQQRKQRGDTQPYLSLADFVAPPGSADYLGGFVVTAGIGAQELADAYIREHDDYSAIMVKALADRLAESFAEHLHRRVRMEFWGYAPDEALDNKQLIAEAYRGIRPAPGYPACPDHTEKATLFQVLDATRNTGVELTEHFAMLPAASVSGWYFSHPDARYFNAGTIGRDQVQSLAERKGLTLAAMERWLQPVLDYEPG